MPEEARPRPLGKKELVKAISEDTRIRPEVVAQVLEKFEDIAMEELANHAMFPLRGFFRISITPVKGGHVGVDGRVAEASTRMNARLSRKIQMLYKLQHGRFASMPYFINRDNWRGALKWALEQKGSSPSSSSSPTAQGLRASHQAEAEDNPFLLDDEE